MRKLLLRQLGGMPVPSQIEREHLAYLHDCEDTILSWIPPRSILYKGNLELRMRPQPSHSAGLDAEA